MSTYRNTKQKSYILDCLKKYSDEHMTIDDIVNIINKDSNIVGKTTVYRYLTNLESRGLVRKYSFKGQAFACYQYVGENSVCHDHYHMVCTNCGKTVHFESEKLGLLTNEINNKNNFFIDAVRTVFYGKCSDCC